MIARLIQFCYLGAYDGSLAEAQQSQSLSIMELVSQGTFPCASEKEKEQARGPFEIDTLMWELANKYNCARLREHIGWKLISQFKLDKELQNDDKRARMYLRVCDLIRHSFHEMPEIEDEMVSVLLDMKLRAYRRNGRKTMAILPMQTDRRTADEAFQGKLFGWMAENASFATKLAMGLEQLLDLTMQTHTHSGSQLEALKGRIRRV